MVYSPPLFTTSPFFLFRFPAVRPVGWLLGPLGYVWARTVGKFLLDQPWGVGHGAWLLQTASDDYYDSDLCHRLARYKRAGDGARWKVRTGPLWAENRNFWQTWTIHFELIERLWGGNYIFLVTRSPPRCLLTSQLSGDRNRATYPVPRANSHGNPPFRSVPDVCGPPMNPPSICQIRFRVALLGGSRFHTRHDSQVWSNYTPLRYQIKCPSAVTVLMYLAP